MVMPPRLQLSTKFPTNSIKKLFVQLIPLGITVNGRETNCALSAVKQTVICNETNILTVISALSAMKRTF